MAEETNAGVTVFVAEITSMCGLSWDVIAVLYSSQQFGDYLQLLLCFQMLFHGTPPLCAVSCNALP